MTIKSSSACLRVLAAALLAAMTGAATADGDPAAGKEKSAQCVACHGEDGNSQNAQFPKLAGQYADYIAHTLEQYKTGERDNVIMKGFAAPLSDVDRADIAAWYSSQESTLGTVYPEN